MRLLHCKSLDQLEKLFNEAPPPSQMELQGQPVEDFRANEEKQEQLDRHAQEEEDFLSRLEKDGESEMLERFQSVQAEFERTRPFLEDEQEFDDNRLNACLQGIQKELGAPELDKLRRFFLERELEHCKRELERRQMQRSEYQKEEEMPGKTGEPAVEFAALSSEFSEALKFLRPARARGRKARADFVDLNACDGEVEIVAPGVSFSFPAQVIRAGYVRVPYLTFEWFSKALKTLRERSIEVAISQGQVKTANLTFKHPDISIRLISARVADLPIDAPLADILALLAKFRPEELSDAGLLARVLAAQETTSELIDRAMKALAPLEIKREELSQFIMEQIKNRSQRDR